MNNTIKNIIALAVLGVMFFVFRTSIVKGFQDAKDRLFPCRYQIAYSLGEVDSRFNVSNREFVDAIEDASNIWESAIGRDLFVYKTDGNLKINLKYDSRQSTTNQLEDINLQVSADRSYYQGLLSEYNSLKKDVDITRSNAKNQNDIHILNQKIDRLNQMANSLNQFAQKINYKVDNYNDVGNSLGGEFEEGLYYSDENGKGIDVYQFKGRDSLVRLLTHELGHALSLDHSEDPNAVMFRLNNSNSLILSDDDIDMLKTHCGLN